MLSLYLTLSLRYLWRRWFRALLIVASIMLGVATLVATQTLSQAMSKSAVSSSNPLAGIVDLIVTNGELPVDRGLTTEIKAVNGVREVHARIYDQAKLVIGKEKHAVMIMGLDLAGDAQVSDEFAAHFNLDPNIDVMKATYFALALAGQTPAILGQELDQFLEKGQRLELFLGMKVLDIEKNLRNHRLVRVASLIPKEKGDLAALGGHVVILDLDNAAKVLGLPERTVRRIDIALMPGADPNQARQDLETVLSGRASVRTIAEQNEALQSPMAGLQIGFSMCGVAALIVGMFLVYNSLSVGVTERRHEIGMLRSLGATRDQVWRLFAGEACALGCVGALLGIPLGIALANLGLHIVQEAISNVFTPLYLRQVEWDRELIILAFVVGIASAVIASLVPAVQASQEQPAEAVRNVPKEPPVAHMVLHVAATFALILCGVGMILVRGYLPAKRWGTYGGLGLIMIGALLAAPLCAHLAASALAPLGRRFFPIAWRLAADNLVRSPGRTGLVIGALAAGVCLVVETAGIIESNRRAVRDWVDTSIAADLVITSGSPIGSGGEATPMQESLQAELRKIPGVEEVLPIHMTKSLFRNVQIAMMTTVADRAYAVEKKRLTRLHDLELLQAMDREENAVIISENFAVLHHVHPGDFITMKSPRGEVKLHVIGKVVDYSWNLGTVVMNRRDFIKHWNDQSVTVFDVYLNFPPDAAEGKMDQNAREVKDQIARQLGAQHDLHPLTRMELKARIDGIIERFYGITYAQQIVVILVAALGIVTALLISVMQRRREMGLLRAIGASQGQVIYLVLAEAFLMGIFGTVIGLVFSIPLQWYALQVMFLEESGYYFPVYLAWGEAAIVALVAVLIATLAGLGPAVFAVQQRIPEAIAYE